MTKIFLTICLLVIAIECALICIEYFRSNKDQKLRNALKETLENNLKLKQQLTLAEKNLESAQTEVQGIYVLWNKALESEKSTRNELNIAKTQLTYLAQKIVQFEKASSNTSNNRSSMSYWNNLDSTEPQNTRLTTTQLVNRQTYQISKADLI